MEDEATGTTGTAGRAGTEGVKEFGCLEGLEEVGAGGVDEEIGEVEGVQKGGVEEVRE